MTVNLILWLSTIWLAPLMWLIMRSETRFKKGIVTGVTLPFQARSDAEVLGILSRFRRQEALICLALMLLCVPCCFARSFSLVFTLWGIWLILCIVLPYASFIACNGRLHELKRRRGWAPPKRSVTETASLGAMASVRPAGAAAYVPAACLSLLPLILDRGFWIIYACDAVCAILCFIVCRYARFRADRSGAGDELDRALTQIRRKCWNELWLVCAWSFAAISLAVLLLQDRQAVLCTVLLAVVLAIVFFAVRADLHVRRIQEKLTASVAACVDEDDRWVHGIFYCNPSDSRLLVSDRTGIGTSLNIARPAGVVIYCLAFALLLAMPFLGPALGSAGDSPIALTASADGVTAENGRTRYFVAAADIADVQLLDSLPQKLLRTAGTGMEHLLKGRFRSPDTGPCRLLVDPTVPPFILIETVSGDTYLLGSRSAEATRAVFDTLTS